MEDSLMPNGVREVYHDFPMGNSADNTASELASSREQQDVSAIASYKRAADATEKGYFKDEIIPIVLPHRKGDLLWWTRMKNFEMSTW